MSHLLPWKICQALMSMVGMLLLTAQGDLRSMLRGSQQVDVWELFCAPDSWLSEACRVEGLKASRINLHQNYDLYKSDSYDRLWDRFLAERPKRIWVSTKCTYWCPFTALNYQGEQRRATLEKYRRKYRRKERAMFAKLIPFLENVLNYDDSVEIFWEWPSRCYGWSEPWLQKLASKLFAANKEWLFCRVGAVMVSSLPRVCSC